MKTSEILTYKRTAEPKTKPDSGKIEIFLAIIGFLAGRVEIWGMLMPAGISWAIANRKNNRLYLAVLTTAAGILLSGAELIKIRGLVALAAIYFLYKSENRVAKESTLFCGIIGAAVNFVSGSIVLSVTGSTGFEYIMLLVEGVLIVGASITFENASEIINRGGSILNEDEGISVYAVLACICAGLYGIEFSGVMLSTVIGMYMIIVASKKCGMGISVTLAAVLSIAAGGDEIIPTLGVYVFLAIGCSVLGSLGKWGIAFGAALANALFTICKIGTTEDIIRAVDIVIAVSAFYFTPKWVLDYIWEYTAKKTDYLPGKSHISRQKIETDSAIMDIEDAVTTVVDIVKEMKSGKETDNNKKEIINKVNYSVCTDCTLKNYCTGKNRKQTEQAISYIIHLIEEKGDCDAADISDVFPWKCIHGDRVVDKVKDAYEFYRAKGLLSKQSDRYREYTLNGLEEMVSIISRRRKRIAQGYETYEGISGEICEFLTRNGIQCGGVCVTKSRDGLYEVSAEIQSEKLSQAEDIIKDLMEINMRTVSEEKTKKGTFLTMREKERYTYDVAVMGLENRDRRSGDCTCWFDDGRGYLYCLVGDGMGSGVMAAKESGWTTKLFEKLIRAGFEMDEALRMINNVMIVGKPSESCISADALKINLKSGTVEFVKAGAASSYIKTAKGVEKVGWASIPLGILEINEMESQSGDISDGGYIIMMSDGVPDTAGDRMEGEHNIRRALFGCRDATPKEIAEYVMFSAMSMGAPKDDMTILVAKIIKQY